jgi:hypothetical protein
LNEATDNPAPSINDPASDPVTLAFISHPGIEIRIIVAVIRIAQPSERQTGE